MKHDPLGPVHVVYNSDFLPGGSAANSHGAEAGQESQEVAFLVADALQAAGYAVEVDGIDDDFGGFDPAGLVFNLVESLGGDPAREPEFPRMLEQRGIAFTGNSASALEVAHAKHHARGALTKAGVRVPTAALFGGSDADVEQLHRLEYPLFVKPALYDGSVGIDQTSVVKSPSELVARLNRLLDIVPGPYLAETYLPGREFNVAVGPHGLGRYAVVTEIDFSGFSADLAPIVTYDCKWIPDCPEAVAHSKPVARAKNPTLYDEVVRQAKRALAAIGAHAYGRVDLRMGADGMPYVIDVNPNPDIHPDAGFAIATRSVGHTIEALYTAIVADAAAGVALRPREVATLW